MGSAFDVNADVHNKHKITTNRELHNIKPFKLVCPSIPLTRLPCTNPNPNPNLKGIRHILGNKNTQRLRVFVRNDSNQKYPRGQPA